MRKNPFLAFLTFAASLAAQSPLQTNLTPNNEGNQGGGLYMDLQVHSTVTITRIDSWVGTAGTTAGSLAMEVWLGPTTYVGSLQNQAMWTQVALATATGYAPSPSRQLLQFDFAAPIALGPGNYGVALRSQSVPPPGTVAWNHAYANGAVCTSSVIPGSCANTVHSTAELTARGGAAQNAFLTGASFQPRMWAGSLHYTNGGTPIPLASAQAYGTGCPGSGGLPALLPTTRPRIAQTFAVDVQNAPTGFGMGFYVVGLSNTAWYYLPLPLDLGFFGMPGCRQYTDIMATGSFGPNSPSPGLGFAIPNANGLFGQRFYLQAVLVDPLPPAGNLVGMVATNAVAIVVGI